MRRPRLLLVAMAAALAGFLPAPYGGKVEAPLPGQPVTLDPALATRQSELQVISLVHDSLYKLDPSGEPGPHLVAPSSGWVQERKVWTFTLRPGVLLSDGHPLDAAQVVASLKRVKKGPNAYLLAPVRTIKAISAASLEITTRKRTPHLPRLLAAPATGVAVSRGKALLGTGPFRLAGVKASAVVLKANPRHFAGRPYLDEVRLRMFGSASAEVAAFQAGALHLSLHGQDLFGAAHRKVVTGIESPACATLFLGAGAKPTYLADAQVRRALLSAIDRRRLTRLMGGGRRVEARGPVCAGLLGKQRKGVAFDRKAARRLLTRAAARLPDLRAAMAGGGRPRLELLVDGSRPEDRALAGQIVAALDGIGISARIEVPMAAAYQARLQSGRFELLLGRMIPQADLGAAALAAAYTLGGKPKTARACLAGRPCGRLAAARFMKDLPLMPLLHLSTRAHHNARLGGLRADAQGLLRYEDAHWARRWR